MSDNITICFYGSSDHELDVKLDGLYQNDIDLIVDSVLKLQYTKIKIVTGGYGGIMNSIAEKFASKKNDSGKNIEIIGITCDAYDFENPDTEKYNKSNDYSIYNDIIIQSENFTDRVQSMIELSDLFIVLPGKQGTLSELLITCESYSFGKYILNGKETKILVHEYWKTILDDVAYFRKFNTEILTFFNAFSVVELIKSYTNNSTKLNTFSQTQYAKKANWQERMIELKGNICKVILGRVYNEKKLLLRLNRDNEFPIFGLDFGWFHIYDSAGKDGEYYSYSTKQYIDFTKEFFDNYNSIMLSNFNKEFEYDYLDGTVKNDEKLTYYTGKSIPQYDSKKANGNFSELRDFFNKKQYGQTIIWKGLKTELDGEGQNDTDVLIFSIFLILKHRIPRASIRKVNQLLSDFMLKAFATKSIELFKEKDKDIINQATRAAISQVMARNTSHNIGAHVMNKLIDAVYLEKFCSYGSCLKSYKPLSDFKETIDHTAFKQLAIYNNYVKCRMDYLSDISYGTPLMQTSKKIWEDVYRGLDKVRLLLENITGLGDNFKYSIKLELVKDDRNIEEVNSKNDFALALPNDILGCQAFYNIVENVIRNTAKHASKVPDEEVKFTLRFSEIDDSLIAALVTIEKEEAQGWMCVEIFDSIHVDDIKNLVNSQNEKLNKPILNESNQLRSNSLGLIEMEASAAYLRKLDSYSIDEDVYEIDKNEKIYNKHCKINALKAISVVCKKDETERHHLGYRFFMLKPQEVLIVTDLPLDNDTSKAINKEKALKKGGVWVVNSDKFVEHLNAGKVYNHQFVVHASEDNYIVKEAIEKHKTSLSIRVLDVSIISKWLISLDYNAEQIIKNCWSSWIKKLGLAEGIIGNSVSCSCQKQVPQACTVDEKFRVVLIDHDKDSWLKYKDCKKANFIEVLSSKALEKLPSLPKGEIINQLTPIKAYVANLNKLDEESNLIFEHQFNQILESSFTQIVVIDERIQKFTEKEFTKGATYFDYYRYMKITVPLMPLKKENAFEENGSNHKESRFNFSANEIDESYSEALKITIEYWMLNLKKNDIILIHYSLLERIFKKEPNKLDAINSFIESKNFECQLILTTGRGIIPGLTPKARFINLSPVITSFVEIGNKHLINYILTSTRKL